MRMVHCTFFEAPLEGLDKPPFPGPLGHKVFKSISKQAFQLWLKEQTKFINEQKLNLVHPETQSFLLKELEDFFFKA